MIDIHTHILPGLDDGARDMEDSLSMAALALKSGVHTLVATSHANTCLLYTSPSPRDRG